MKLKSLTTLSLCAAAALVTSAQNTEAALIKLTDPCIPSVGNPTNEFLALEALVGPGYVYGNPNGSWVKYDVVEDDGVSVSSGDAEDNPDTDSITVSGVEIDGTLLSFDDQEPFYFLVKAANDMCFYYYDGDGPVVDLLSPITNKNGNPQAYSHVTFFGITDDGGTPGVPEGGTSVALLGLALAGLGAARRFTKKA